MFSTEKTYRYKNKDNKSPAKISNYSIGNQHGSTSLVMNNKAFFEDSPKPIFEPDYSKKNEIFEKINLYCRRATNNCV